MARARFQVADTFRRAADAMNDATSTTSTTTPRPAATATARPRVRKPKPRRNTPRSKVTTSKDVAGRTVRTVRKKRTTKRGVRGSRVSGPRPSASRGE